MNYTQCHLVKGNKHQTAYIPSKFAVVGKIVKLLKEDGWLVTDTYTTMSEGQVLENSKDHTRTRKASDV